MTGRDTGQLVLLGVGLLLAGVLLVLSVHRYGSPPELAVHALPTQPVRQGRQGSPPAGSIFESWKRSRFGP